MVQYSYQNRRCRHAAHRKSETLSRQGGPSALRKAVLHILRIPEKDLLALHILRRSIDAREGVRMVYTVEVEAADEAAVLRRCRDKHVSKAPPGPSINSRSL